MGGKLSVYIIGVRRKDFKKEVVSIMLNVVERRNVRELKLCLVGLLERIFVV